MKKKIAIFTGNRAEYGLQVPILREIQKDIDLEYLLIVSGAHLDDNFGSTIAEIKKDGFIVHEKILTKDGSKSLYSTSHAIGEGVIAITNIIKKHKPDFFIVYADRYETFAAAIASSQTNTPTIHIEGGDITEGGALDDSVRHAITKLSHIHYTTNEESSKRIISMGEESWRVKTVGYPGIDLINDMDYLSERDVLEYLGLSIDKPILIFTQHSVTNKFKLVEEQLTPVLDALEIVIRDFDVQCILTYPNNDAGGDNIYLKLEKFSKSKNNVNLYQSLGRRAYWGLLNLSKSVSSRVVCVGNSSSGIKETPAFGCPVVNIGTRQKGRLRGTNVIDCEYNKKEIYDGIEKCLFDEKFRTACRSGKNPYGIGNAGKKIVTNIKLIQVDDRLMTKKMTIK